MIHHMHTFVGRFTSRVCKAMCHRAVSVHGSDRRYRVLSLAGAQRMLLLPYIARHDVMLLCEVVAWMERKSKDEDGGTGAPQ